MQQHGDVVFAGATDQVGDQRRIGLDQPAPAGDGRIERQQAFGFVGQKPARIVVKDGRRPAGALAQFQELVDLLLILRDGDAAARRGGHRR